MYVCIHIFRQLHMDICICTHIKLACDLICDKYLLWNFLNCWNTVLAYSRDAKMAILLLWDIQSNTYVWQVNQGGGRNEHCREQGGHIIVKDTTQRTMYRKKNGRTGWWRKRQIKIGSQFSLRMRLHRATSKLHGLRIWCTGQNSQLYAYQFCHPVQNCSEFLPL